MIRVLHTHLIIHMPKGDSRMLVLHTDVGNKIVNVNPDAISFFKEVTVTVFGDVLTEVFVYGHSKPLRVRENAKCIAYALEHNSK